MKQFDIEYHRNEEKKINNSYNRIINIIKYKKYISNILNSSIYLIHYILIHQKCE